MDIHTCMPMHVFLHKFIPPYICMDVSIYVICVCMYIYTCLAIYILIYVCLYPYWNVYIDIAYIHRHIYMHAYIHSYIYIYIYIYIYLYIYMCVTFLGMLDGLVGSPKLWLIPCGPICTERLWSLPLQYRVSVDPRWQATQLLASN